MTVEQEVDALTAAVDTLKSTVVSKKATLDASVSDAQAATALATTAKTAALSARDQASASKDAAYAYAQSAGSAVAYQDLTALAASKAVTAVDVFIYDTSKDSDGGAWRHRCTGTSWYNETLNTATRGSRREFPAVAVLVLEKGKLTIYDGDDPDLPMWMIINGYSIGVYLFVDGYGCEATSIAARNGALVATGKPIGDPSEGNNFGGALIFNFVSDTTQKIGTYGYNSNYGTKNGVRVVNFGPLGTFQRPPVVRLPNGWINDVVMTVLPDAQENPSTGLPELTLAFATKGGVAVLRQDGSVISSSETLEAGDVVFTPENELISGYYAAHLRIYGPVDKLTSPTFSQKGIVAAVAGGTINVPFYMNSFTDGRAFGGTGTRGGLTKLMLNSASIGSLCAAAISASYNTGWMPGYIKGAFLSSTDTASLVGSGELVTNGTFDTDADWTKVEFSISGGVAVPNSSATTCTLTQTGLGLVAGQAYTLEFDVSGRTVGNLYPRAGSYNNLATLNSAANGHHFFTFIAASDIVQIVTNAGFDGVIDNISVQLADADRSVNNNDLIVNGTVTRSPVATGAELVAYSGFSSSNYLEQPYNSDLDFGTGDFCVMGWAKFTGTSNMGFLHRESVFNGGSGFGLYPTSGQIAAQVGGTATLTDGKRYDDGTWKHLVLLRRLGQAYLFVNGSQVWAAARAGSITDPTATLRLGARHDGNALTTGSLALWRISATAPTAEQIAKIYEDEKVLFQENAQATLYGASDAVTALAHDPDTGLLHVGTSQGRSVFKGLRRVSNTTTGVGTAISAANGMVIEE